MESAEQMDRLETLFYYNVMEALIVKSRINRCILVHHEYDPPLHGNNNTCVVSQSLNNYHDLVEELDRIKEEGRKLANRIDAKRRDEIIKMASQSLISYS